MFPWLAALHPANTPSGLFGSYQPPQRDAYGPGGMHPLYAALLGQSGVFGRPPAPPSPLVTGWQQRPPRYRSPWLLGGGGIGAGLPRGWF